MSTRRGIKTIIGSFFRKRGQMGAEASNATFFTSVFFVAALACFAISFIMWWFPYHLFSDEVYNIVVVNSPDSFKQFNKDMQQEFDEMAEDYGDRYDYFANWENMADFEYIYVGYGWTEFIYKDTDALYDFVTFGKWMRENDAYLTVVFPKDFDEQIRLRQEGKTDAKPQILTYYRTNSMEYSQMREGFIEEYLDYYQSTIRENYGLKITSVEDSEIIDDPIPTVENGYGIKAFTDTMSRTFVPILLFVILLYASMSIGTNVIAGQKERGTFTGILLTPLPRYAIIIGYLGGVVLKTLIPAFIIATLSVLLAQQFSIGAFISIYIYIFVLAVFIASVTILISVINDTVVSAQTAFLPVFLILVAVCVTCIQSVAEREDFYMFMPVHGQFYGIGDVLTGSINVPGLAVSSIATLFLSAIIIFVTVKLLHSERYTVSIDTVDAKEVRRYREGGRSSVLEYFNKATDSFSYFITELFYPLIVLSFYQFLAMIPVVVAYMRKPEYSSFIQDLQNVGSVNDIFNKTFEIFGIFFKDPLFLGMMTLGYILIIVTYFIHAGRVWKIKGIKNKIGACGYPLTSGKHIAKNYCLGFLLGFLMMTATVGIMRLTGQLTFGGFNLSVSGLGAFIFNLFMWFPQGASEELMFRGYMIPAFNKRYKTAVGVVVSSILFSAFHSLNPGFTPLASINLALIAVLFALIYLLTGDIWMTSAMHTAWNLTQGNIYGLQVSGNLASNTVVKIVYDSNANPVITGGTFGPEGGLATTAVTCVCMVIVIALLISKSRKARK
ncbi:MAG: ABC transporter permease [Saccharofermentans sp.]|nr:ABC transporter permease [Saccharofermentans sp.]